MAISAPYAALRPADPVHLMSVLFLLCPLIWLQTFGTVAARTSDRSKHGFLPHRPPPRSDPMTITEATRHRLHQHLASLLGEEDAAVLMEHLPPTGWADVATRRDLDHIEHLLRADLERVEQVLRADVAAMESRIETRFSQMESRIEARFGQVDARFGQVDARFGEVQAEFTKQLLLANGAMVGLVFGIVRFLS